MTMLGVFLFLLMIISSLLGVIAFFQNSKLRQQMNDIEKRMFILRKQLDDTEEHGIEKRDTEEHGIEEQGLDQNSETPIKTQAAPKTKRAAQVVAAMPEVKSKPQKRVAPLEAESKLETPIAPPPPQEPKQMIELAPADKNGFVTWLVENWAYALGALSLALAGIYIVRLGMEQGYFPPVMRIFVSLVFGAALIGVADWLRKRGGDEKDDATAYIPSTVASAGFATLFAAIMGADTLYHLITPVTSFAGMAIVACFAILAGWRFGALLSAFGVVGAFLAPMMVGESSSTGYVMFIYALLVMAMTLAVDSVKRTAWLSLWGMVASFGFALLVFVSGSSEANLDIYSGAYLGFALAFLLLTTIIPERRLMPQMGEGGLIASAFVKIKLPEFPARLVGGAMLANVIIFTIVKFTWPTGFSAIMFYVAILAVLCFFWLGKSAALEEYALVPLGMVLFLLFAHIGTSAHIDPQTLISIVILGMVLALSSALAAQTFKQFTNLWQHVSIGYPFVFAVLLLANWSRGVEIPYWPFFLMLFAAMTIMMVYHYWQRLGKSAQIVDIGVIAIWGYGAMAAWCFLPHYALIIAFGALVVPLTLGAMRFSWRFHELAAKLWTGIASSYAIYHCFGHPDWPHIAILAVFSAGAYGLYRQCKETHENFRIHFEAWGFVLASAASGLTILKIFAEFGIDSNTTFFGVYALFFIAQIIGIRHRLSIIDNAQMVRKVILAVYIFLAFASVAILLLLLPLWHGKITGWPLFNDMLIGYLFPALALIGMHRWRPAPKQRWDFVGFGIIVLWLIMVVRHFWQGSPDIRLEHPTGSNELYSYTVMMLLAMAASMSYAIKNNNALWRRVAYALIILTGIKLYFVDLAQFEGVLPVIALFIFGVILIGFNFVDRKYKLGSQE